jgi:hypothetical protein
MSNVPMITLNDGVEIPQMGFGTFQIDQSHTREATLQALDAGYRHIDTAEMYGNEKGVGAAVRDFDADRADIFVTSKLNNGFHAYDDALAAFDRTMDDLGLDYIDLFLIHWPLPAVGDYVETWESNGSDRPIRPLPVNWRVELSTASPGAPLRGERRGPVDQSDRSASVLCSERRAGVQRRTRHHK